MASSLFGATLQSKDGMVDTDTALKGKTAIGIYFSAHWCPPCRGFTPKLASAYTDHLKAKGLEIVFVSSDRDEASFDSYYAEQPWLSLPYSARDLKAKLSKKYKVSGIPSFIVLDGETLETISTDGRSDVMEDPTGERFPWKPPTFWEALGDEFLSGTDGETVEVDELKGEGKYIGLYFSAHWCPPCRGFTPELVKAYKDHLKAKNLEIIFVSSDKDQKAFSEYYGTMPWLAIPQGDKRKAALSKMFDVEGIPTFAIVDAATGKTITTKGRGNVASDPEGKSFPEGWAPQPLVDIATGDPDGINEELCLVALLDGCDAATTEKAASALLPIAKASKDSGETTCFFYASKASGPVPQVRQLCGLGDAPKGAAQLVLLDIPDNGGFYVSAATEVTADAVNQFLNEYKAGTLERKQLS